MSLQKTKIVRIKGSADISHKLLHDLGKKVKPYGFSKIIPFESKAIIVADWVHQKCLYGCRRYNTKRLLASYGQIAFSVSNAPIRGIAFSRRRNGRRSSPIPST